MIKKFVDLFMEKRPELEAMFILSPPARYKDIVKAVVEVLHSDDDYESVDPTRIHEIDDGDYQGTLLYVIGDTNYQPSGYWYVKVSYGSCSGCDTLQAIFDMPTEQQVKQYMTLALHVVQGLRKME